MVSARAAQHLDSLAGAGIGSVTSKECRMTDQDDENLTEEAKQLYRKTKLPHKFCPYCGTRNEAGAQECSNCGKDISWMRIPEPIPYSEPPKEKPRGLPEQQKIFTPRVIVVIALIVALLFAFVLVILLVTKGKSAELLPVSGVLMALGLCVPDVRPLSLHLRSDHHLS